MGPAIYGKHLYLNGRGVDKDEDAALGWINRVALQKDRRAQGYLANASIEIK